MLEITAVQRMLTPVGKIPTIILTYHPSSLTVVLRGRMTFHPHFLDSLNSLSVPPLLRKQLIVKWKQLMLVILLLIHCRV